MEANKIVKIEEADAFNDVNAVFEDGTLIPFNRRMMIQGAYRDGETYYGYIITLLRDLTNLPKTYCHPFVKQIIHLLALDKVYYIQYNVGSSKYVVNYHDGEKKHNDGSDFYDIFLTNNKRTLAKFVSGLKKQGYTERMFFNLTNSIKMTREEEIKRGAKYNANGTTDDVLAEMYFIRGAEWADEHPKEGLWDSEKVIEWIKNNAGSYLEDNHKFGEGSEFCTTELLDDLRKAMEKQHGK